MPGPQTSYWYVAGVRAGSKDAEEDKASHVWQEGLAIYGKLLDPSNTEYARGYRDGYLCPESA